MVDGRRAIAQAVRDARLARGWGKEEAARQAGVSSITWKRVEDGFNVQDAKLALILDALDIQAEAVDDAAADMAHVDSLDEVVRIAERVAAEYMKSGGDPVKAAELIAAAVEKRDAGVAHRISDTDGWAALRPPRGQEGDEHGRKSAPTTAADDYLRASSVALPLEPERTATPLLGGTPEGQDPT